MTNETQQLLKAHHEQQAMEKLRELVAMTADQRDLRAVTASLALCATLEYSLQDYPSALAYLLELVLPMSHDLRETQERSCKTSQHSSWPISTSACAFEGSPYIPRP